MKEKKNWRMPRRDLNLHSNFLSLPFTLFEPYGALFIMNSKMHLRKNSSNEYFKTISHYRLVYSLSGFIQAARLTDWSSSSLLSLNCPMGLGCICSPRLFASEIFSNRPTYNKQRMNKMNPSRCTCCLETQNARWRHVMACCQATADTKPIERFMTKA